MGVIDCRKNEQQLEKRKKPTKAKNSRKTNDFLIGNNYGLRRAVRWEGS